MTNGHHRLKMHVGRYCEGSEDESLRVRLQRCKNSDQTELPFAYIFPVGYVRRMAAAHQVSADVANWMSPFHMTPCRALNESRVVRYVGPVYRFLRYFMPWIDGFAPSSALLSFPFDEADSTLDSTVDYDDPNSLPSFGYETTLGTIEVGSLYF
jgi:hypothetical protein